MSSATVLLKSNFSSSIPQPISQLPLETNHRFPKDFGIYRALGSMSDLIIALHTDDPNPLFYISIHGTFSRKPNVILHSNRWSNSPPLATANFPSFTSSIDIEVMASSLYPFERTTLDKEGVFSISRVFMTALPGSNAKERFEWKRSSGKEVASLHGKSQGEKLVRCKTGEVVAAWTSPGMSRRKRGKMSFFGDREALGEKFEIMAVMCMLGIMLRRGSSGASTGGGAAGGGGC